MQNNTSDWFCSCIRHTWRTGSWSVLCLLGDEVALWAGVGGWNILWRCNSRIWSSWVLSPSAREVASTPRGILPVLCFLVVGGGDTLLLKASHWARRGASSNTAKKMFIAMFITWSSLNHTWKTSFPPGVLTTFLSGCYRTTSCSGWCARPSLWLSLQI